MSAPAQAGVRQGGDLGAAWAAMRARLGVVALLFVVAGAAWWWTAGQMEGMDNGPWTGLGGLGWFVSGRLVAPTPAMATAPAAA